jgi:LmbE family N-acetylglucosaminyl deacetylase
MAPSIPGPPTSISSADRPPTVRPRVQVVVAHPDDETFGCGSWLLHAAAAGAVTAVCCATRGEAGEPPPSRTWRPAELAAVRERELREAAALLGVERVDLLDFVDSGMTGPLAPDSLSGAPFEQVVSAVVQRVADFRPDVLLTIEDSDGHRDHTRIRDAALAAARAVDVPRVYLNCLPRSLMARWLAVMREQRPDIAYLDEDITAIGTPDEDMTTVVDTTEHLVERERAIAAHASQTSPFEGLPPDLRQAFLGTSYARRVVPPWTGGPREEFLVPVADRSARVDPARAAGRALS